MTRRTRTDVQLEAAATLLGSLAARHPAAVAQLRRELDAIDGYPTVTVGNGVVARGSSELTATERAAAWRVEASGTLDDLAELASIVVEMVITLHRQTDRALGLRKPTAAEEVRCRDSLHGRAGALEWGDPTCEELAAKVGLCSACYQRERRWRIANDLVERDTVPAR